MPFRQDADPARRHHGLARLIAILGDLLAKAEPPPAAPLLVPALAVPLPAPQPVSHLRVAVVHEVFLGVEARGPGFGQLRATAGTDRIAAGSEPRNARTGPTLVVRVEVVGGDREGGRHDDGRQPLRSGAGGIRIDGIGVAHRPGEHQDMGGLDGELDLCHRFRWTRTLPGRGCGSWSGPCGSTSAPSR